MFSPISYLVVFLGFVPPLVLSQATLPIIGPNPSHVIVTTMSLTDHSRLDPFTSKSRPREIMISGFSPVGNCQNETLQPYMPLKTAIFQDTKFAAYGLPNGSFQSLTIPACTSSSKSKACTSTSLPLVLFSGALATSRLLYTSMLQSISAAGYLVVSIDHPYDADIVEFPDGTVITGVDIPDSELENALSIRTDDIEFIYKQLTTSPTLQKKLFPSQSYTGKEPRTALIGHSFGGAAAASATQRLRFIRGAVNLDGTLFGSVVTTGLDRPFMFLGHENKTQATDPSWKAIWPILSGWKKEVEVKGAAHYSFSDLPLVARSLGIQEQLPEEVEGALGRIEGKRMMGLSVSYLAGFLDMVLKTGKERGLVRAEREFPEAVVVI